ncbi:MAG: protein kinase [Pirellulaceae bacterium]|nr:protein kinase [Pirellulaceae bacterium]
MTDEQPTLAGDRPGGAGSAEPRRDDGSATLAAVPEEVASQLIGILDEYVERLKAGSAPSHAQLIAAHPELARQLEACLAGLEFIHGTARTAAAQPVALGDFRILREVGRGGMGAVYEAEQKSLGRRVALKVLRFGAVSEPEAITRFQREAETVAQLHHTNIVPIFSVGTEHGVNFYAMQFIEGRSLAQVLTDRAGPADPNQVAEWGLQAAEALEHAHRRGVIHRDVKPSNLLLDNDGRIWLTDFGLAKRLDDATLSMTGALLGTPRYMSPEQASSGERRIDHRTDIYSLGATLYELATGQPVFDGDSPHRVIARIVSDEVTAPRLVRPGLPRDLETILLKCLHKDSAQRYQSARALADDLRAFSDGRPIAARRLGMFDRGVKWLRRQRRSVALTAATIAATLLLIAGIFASNAMYARWRSSSLALDTPNPPLVAEVFDGRGRSVAGPVTVPLQQPLAIPAGDYEVEVSGKGRFSQRCQLHQARNRLASYELSLEDQRLWPEFDVTCTYTLVPRGDRKDLRLMDKEGVRLMRGMDARLEWTRDVASLHQEARWNAPGFVWDWKQGDYWYYGFDELDQRPHSPESSVDLDGDGHADVVLAGRHQAWLLAMSGRSGDVLWLSALGEDARHPSPQPRVLPHGTVSGVWGPVEVLPDVNGDGCPDLLVTVVDVSASPDAGASTAAPRRRVEAISGADGSVVWSYEIPAELFELQPGQETPHRMQWFFGRHFGHTGGATGGTRSGTYTRRSQRWYQQRSGAAVFMPQAARRVPLPHPGDSSCILVLAGSHMVRLATPSGQPLAPPADLGVLPGQPTVVRDLDGDGTPELILMDEVAATYSSARPGTLVKPVVRVSVCSLRDASVIWQREVVAWWPERPRWHLAPSQWPVVANFDGDGRCDLVVPDGSSEWQSRGLDSAPWGELVRLDGATGEVRWRRRIRCLDQFVDRFTVGPDMDGDGTPDVYSAVFWDNQGDVYVDATSGGDGRPLSWIRCPATVGSPRSDMQLLGPMFWWSADREAAPLLAVTTTDGGTNEISFSVACLSVQRGEQIQLAMGLGYLETADLDGDGACELLSFQTKDRQEMIDYGGKLTAFRGSAGVAWRRLERRLEPVSDLDGDGIFDVVSDRIGGPFRALSGKDGTALWTADVRDLLHSDRPLLVAAQASTADRDGDGVADLIVHQDDLVTVSPVSVLHALSGRTGRRLWSSELKTRLVRDVLRVSSADLDRDGTEEILWVGLAHEGPDTEEIPNWHSSRMLLAILDGRDGRLRWKQPLSVEYGQSLQSYGFQQPRSIQLEIALGDLNGDGSQDVLVPVEASLEPLRMEMQAFSGLDGRRLWSAPVELPRTDSNALADLLPCTVTDVNLDGAVEVLLLDYVTASRSDGMRQLNQRLRVLSGDSGEELWARTFPVAHSVGHLPQNSPERRLYPRITVLQRRDAEPWLSLNLWASPEEVVVLDCEGNEVSRLRRETARGTHPVSFRFHGCDVDRDGNDELVLFHQDALVAIRPESPDQPLWRWPVDTLNSHRVTQIRQPSGDSRPTIVVQSPHGNNQVIGLDAATGKVRWVCGGPTTRGREYVEVMSDAVILSDAEASGPPRLLFQHRSLCQSLLGRRFAADDAVLSEPSRTVAARGSMVRPVSATDPRFVRRFPGTPPYVEWGEIGQALAWSVYYSGLLLGLPLLYASWLLRSRQWSLRMWLMLPAVVLIMLTAISTKASGALFPTWGSRVFGAVSTLPMLWLIYRVLAWSVRSQWRRVGSRTAVVIGLVCLFALIPWIVALVIGEGILDDGERFTYSNSQWLLIPAAYLTVWLLFLWDLCWISVVALNRWLQTRSTVNKAEAAA